MEIDKKNLTVFLAILVVMVALVGTGMFSSEIEIKKVGRPVVRPPFNESDYNIIFNENGIVIELSSDVIEEYDGRFLSVYAYDAQGNHVFKLKRVVNGRILISKDEAPGSIASFSGNIVSSIENADKRTSFYQILKDARDSGRLFGLERCLLGKQCIKICPVAAIEVLIKDPNSEGKGRIIPGIDYDKCIESGLCATRCPTNLIVVEKDESK